MLLYIVSKDNIGDWSLESGNSYTIKNQLFESDIYCDFLNTAVEATVLANSNIQFEFDNTKPLPLNLLSINADNNIAGSFCSLNDIWLDAGNDNALIISSTPLTLNKASLDRIKRSFSNNLVYNLSAQNNTAANAQTATTASTDTHPTATADHDVTTNGATAADVLPTEANSSGGSINATAAATDTTTVNNTDRVMDDNTPPSHDLHDTMMDDDSSIGALHTTTDTVGTKPVARAPKPGVLDTLEEESSIFKIFFNWLYKKLHLDVVMDNKYVKSALDSIKAVFLWMKSNLLLTTVMFIVIAIMVIVALVVIGFNGDNDVGIRLPQQSIYYNDQTLMNVRQVKQLSSTLPITNLNVYQQYNHCIVSGIVNESATLHQVKQILRQKLTNIPLTFHLYTLADIQDGIATLEDDFQLSCDYDPHLTKVTCFGMVNDKDSAKEEILGEYQYNEVLPLSLNLFSNQEVENYLDDILQNNPLFVNVHYSLDSDGTLTLYGYISAYKLAYLGNQLKQLLQKIPFLHVINNLRTVEQAIDLHIKQLIFNDYGNTLVDNDGNEYNVGSHYRNFIITSIQKNTVILRDGANIIKLSTPFNTDTVHINDDSDVGLSNTLDSFGGVMVNESTTPLAVPNSDSIMGDIPPIVDSSFSTGTEANANSKTIIKNEVAKQIADVNEKKQVLSELRQAQNNNTNPALKHSYADLIANITSDLNNEEQNVSAATQ